MKHSIMLAGHYFTFPAAEFIVVVIPEHPSGPSLAFSHGEACATIIQSNPYQGAVIVYRGGCPFIEAIM